MHATCVYVTCMQRTSDRKPRWVQALQVTWFPNDCAKGATFKVPAGPCEIAYGTSGYERHPVVVNAYVARRGESTNA